MFSAASVSSPSLADYNSGGSVMASRIRSILVAAIVMVALPVDASATVIFNNFPGSGGITGTGFPQFGDEVTAAPGTPRVVTELDLGFTTGNVGPQSANLQAFLYANDGSGGSPGTLLWQSAVMLGVSINSTNATVAFIVPSIVVPNTFTFTAAITNQSGNFGYAPASGATTGTFVAPWGGSPGSWSSFAPVFEVEGRVITVPEPATLVLIGIGLAGLGISRRQLSSISRHHRPGIGGAG
jgi:PEP-CTERM motif